MIPAVAPCSLLVAAIISSTLLSLLSHSGRVEAYFYQHACTDQYCQTGCVSDPFIEYACYDTYDNSSAVSWCDTVNGVLKQKLYYETSNCSGGYYNLPIPLNTCEPATGGIFNSVEYTCQQYASAKKALPPMQQSNVNGGDVSSSPLRVNSWHHGGRHMLHAARRGATPGLHKDVCPNLEFEFGRSGNTVIVRESVSLAHDTDDVTSTRFMCKVHRDLAKNEMDKQEGVPTFKILRLASNVKTLVMDFSRAHASDKLVCWYDDVVAAERSCTFTIG